MPDEIAPKTITVHLNPDGTPECVPIVTRVRPGGTLVWGGRVHTGVFDGRIAGPLRYDFTLADFATLQMMPGPMPFHPASWQVIDETPGAFNPSTVTVDANAESGMMYKYSITAGGRTLDPVIIVDDSA